MGSRSSPHGWMALPSLAAAALATIAWLSVASGPESTTVGAEHLAVLSERGSRGEKVGSARTGSVPHDWDEEVLLAEALGVDDSADYLPEDYQALASLLDF